MARNSCMAHTSLAALRLLPERDLRQGYVQATLTVKRTQPPPNTNRCARLGASSPHNTLGSCLLPAVPFQSMSHLYVFFSSIHLKSTSCTALLPTLPDLWSGTPAGEAPNVALINSHLTNAHIVETPRSPPRRQYPAESSCHHYPP